MACQVVKLAPRQSLRIPGRRSKGAFARSMQEEHSRLLSDGQPAGQNQVPRGFMAVYVGPELRRFVIPMKFLSLPDFMAMMERSAEEFGYEQEGVLRIPCDEQDFERLIARCSTLCQVI